MRAAIPLLGLALLAACGSRNDDAGSISPEEDRLLNEAASSIDANAMAAPDPSTDVNAAIPANASDSGNTQ